MIIGINVEHMLIDIRSLESRLVLISNKEYGNYDNSCIIGLEFECKGKISLRELDKLKEEVTDLLESSNIEFYTTDIFLYDI